MLKAKLFGIEDCELDNFKSKAELPGREGFGLTSAFSCLLLLECRAARFLLGSDCFFFKTEKKRKITFESFNDKDKLRFSYLELKSMIILFIYLLFLAFV